MKILGISAYYHDSAAALLDDGEILAAAQEERFSRRKHDARFPANAVAYCLAEAGIRLADADHVVFYDKPWIKFAHARDLPRVRAEGIEFVPRLDAAMAQREAQSEVGPAP